jgi:hypothetical protein
MFDVRESWTDERLDDFRGEVNRRFDKVDVELQRMNDRLDAMGRVMIQGFVAMTGAVVAGSVGWPP